MYAPGTILERKEPREDYAYNRIRVIGQSPINHTETAANWQGAESQGVLVEPLSGFEATADVPLGELQSLYTVESIPEIEIVPEPIKVIPDDGSAGPSPEEVFKQDAREVKRKSRSNGNGKTAATTEKASSAS